MGLKAFPKGKQLQKLQKITPERNQTSDLLLKTNVSNLYSVTGETCVFGHHFRIR